MTEYIYSDDNLLEKVTNTTGAAAMFEYYDDKRLHKTFTAYNYYDDETMENKSGIKSGTKYEYYKVPISAEEEKNGMLKWTVPFSVADGTETEHPPYYKQEYDNNAESPGLGRISDICETVSHADTVFCTTGAEGIYNTHIEHDKLDRLAGMTNALGHSTGMTYYKQSRLRVTSTDIHGNTTYYCYDANGNLIGRKDPLDFETLYAYDTEDRLKAIISPRANAHIPGCYEEDDNMLYDKPNTEEDELYGHLKGNDIENIMKFAVRQEYDARGRLSKVIIPHFQEIPGKTMQPPKYKSSDELLYEEYNFEYDNSGNLDEELDADKKNTIKSYGYDAADNLIRIGDGFGNTTCMTYDARNRMSHRIDPLLRVTRFEYDDQDRLISSEALSGENADAVSGQLNADCTLKTGGIIPSGNGGQSADGSLFDSDGDNAACSSIGAAQGKNRQYFDADGNLNCAFDAEGNRTLFHYNGAGRLAEEESAAMTGPVQYEYNDRGLLKQMTNARGDQRL
ncbi:MAG: RHS repeat protein, partial [Gammaproteobacteria bacterium]|nr:RHS repeat protein [Gammaproteobacteria bacterium]